MRAIAPIFFSVIAIVSLASRGAFAQRVDAGSPSEMAGDASASRVGDAGGPLPAADLDAGAPPGSDPDAGATSAGPAAVVTNNGVEITATRVALVDTAPIGVDPAAGTFVNAVLREQFARLNFTLVAQEQLYEAARRFGLPFPVPEQGLAQLAAELGAQMVFACDLRARSGYYFATVRVRRIDEPQERSLAVVATQWTLGDRVREAVSLLLRGANQTSVTNASPDMAAAMSAVSNTPIITPSYYGNIPVPARPPVLVHPRPFELGILGFGAFNPGRDPYTNALFGARFAWFPIDRLGVSAALQYTNLRGRSGRVHNVLPMIGVESAVDLVPSIALIVPIRAEVGYLPFNGPVIRFSAGLSFRLYQQLRLELDVVQPTIWWVNENASVSLDAGAYLTWTFGADRTPRPRRRRRRRPAPATTAGSTSAAPTNSSSESNSSANATPPATPPS